MPDPPPTVDTGKTESGRDARGRRLRAEHTYVHRVVADPDHEVNLRYTPGRGRTIDWDGERYLPEAVTKELGRFYAWMVPAVCVMSGVLGWMLGHYWL